MKKPNIILISFDDCRADRLGVAGYKKNVTPFLDSLARESAYFSRAFATGSGSPQSFVGTLTSTYPMDHGGFSFIDRPRVLVSEALQKAGYKTVAVHSAAYMSDYFGYDRGWDIFRYLSHFDDGGTMPGIRKDTFQARVLRRIAAARRSVKKRLPLLSPLFGFLERISLLIRKIVNEAKHFTPPFFLGSEINKEIQELMPQRPREPLFLWVHYMDVHEPLGFFWRNGRGFWKKVKYHLGDLALFIFGDIPSINRLFKLLYEELYDASVRSVDSHIGDMVSYLKSRKILGDDDVLVVLSDHGEEFFEKGAFGHEQRPFNANLNVPLMFYSPARIKPKKETWPVSLIDVSPTILGFAGAHKPASYKGAGIFDAKERTVAAQTVDCEGDLTNLRYLGGAIFSGGYKYIQFNGKEMLYTLDDIQEKCDLSRSHPEILASMRAEFKKFEPEESPGKRE